MSGVLRFDIRQAGRSIAIVLGVLALANVLFFVLKTRPAVSEYRTLLDENSPTLEKLRDQEELVEAMESFLVAVRQAEVDLTSIRDDILSTRNKRLVEVEAELARLCEAFQIPLISVGFDNELLMDEELDRFVMSVPLEGGYRNLRRFIQAVEGSDKFLLIDRVALERGKEGGVLLSLSITLSTYFNLPDHLKEKKRKLGRRSRRST